MIRFSFIIVVILLIDPSIALADQPSYSVFSCTVNDGDGTKGDLNWWENSYSGYRWIACRVDADQITITNVKINGGNCFIVNDWFLNRPFKQGEVVNISHSCLDPVLIELHGNGKTSLIKLK